MMRRFAKAGLPGVYPRGWPNSRYEFDAKFAASAVRETTTVTRVLAATPVGVWLLADDVSSDKLCHIRTGGQFGFRECDFFSAQSLNASADLDASGVR
jgi:hypothetical protein